MFQDHDGDCRAAAPRLPVHRSQPHSEGSDPLNVGRGRAVLRAPRAAGRSAAAPLLPLDAAQIRPPRAARLGTYHLLIVLYCL